MPSFFLGHGEDLTQPYNDQTEAYSQYWAGLGVVQDEYVDPGKGEDGKKESVS